MNNPFVSWNLKTVEVVLFNSFDVDQNGKPLEVGQDPFLHVTGGGEHLNFLRVLPHHGANYTCVATNIAGEDSITYDTRVMGKTFIEPNSKW